MSGAEGVRRELSAVIRADAAEIAERWMTRVKLDLAARPDVSPTQLRDGIPDYLTELARLLEVPENAQATDGAAGWARIAREHGITRVQIGFDIDQLVREFIALRHAIRAVAKEKHGVAVEAADSTLADLIDAAIGESVRAYVDARDSAARRVQAENIGFLTHELRNPLTAAVGAENAVRETGVPDQSRAALDILERSHDRLTKLIESVLETQRLEAGRTTLRYVDMPVRDVVDAAVAVARKTALDKNVAFDVRYVFDERVRVDPDLTRSAIQNLVDNAAKYTDFGSVDVVVEGTTSEWSVHVRDTGPGLSPQELRTIFEPFRRGSTSKKGTGLGLAIARRAVEAQGGSIHAESTAPVGCHFWIQLPIR